MMTPGLQSSLVTTAATVAENTAEL